MKKIEAYEWNGRLFKTPEKVVEAQRGRSFDLLGRYVDGLAQGRYIGQYKFSGGEIVSILAEFYPDEMESICLQLGCWKVEKI